MWEEGHESGSAGSLSHFSPSVTWLFMTSWTAARQAILSITSSRNPLRLHVHWVSDPFSSHFQSFLASGSFQLRRFSWGGQSIGVSASASVLPMNAAAAAAAAKSLQSCPTLCNPIDGSPPGSPIPGVLQARTLEWVAISFSNSWKWKVKVKSLSCVRLLVTPWTAAYQAPPSMGFSRQEYWSGVPLPSRLQWIFMTDFL